jgi:hypothetical protein
MLKKSLFSMGVYSTVASLNIGPEPGSRILGLTDDPSLLDLYEVFERIKVVHAIWNLSYTFVYQIPKKSSKKHSFFVEIVDYLQFPL